MGFSCSYGRVSKHQFSVENCNVAFVTRSQLCKARHNRRFLAHYCCGKWSREGCFIPAVLWKRGSLELNLTAALHFLSRARWGEGSSSVWLHVCLIESWSTVQVCSVSSLYPLIFSAKVCFWPRKHVVVFFQQCLCAAWFQMVWSFCVQIYKITSVVIYCSGIFFFSQVTGYWNSAMLQMFSSDICCLYTNIWCFSPAVTLPKVLIFSVLWILWRENHKAVWLFVTKGLIRKVQCSFPWRVSFLGGSCFKIVRYVCKIHGSSGNP